MAYVLKLTDPVSSGFIYIGKGSILGDGNHGWFLDDYVFETTTEAREHIQTCLNSGWYRDDVTEACFEVVEVNKYPKAGPYFYYTKDEYEKIIWED